MALGHESKRAAVEAVQTILRAARQGDHPQASVLFGGRKRLWSSSDRPPRYIADPVASRSRPAARN